MTLPLVRNTSSIRRHMYTRHAVRLLALQLCATPSEYRMRFLAAACNSKRQTRRERNRERRSNDDLARAVHPSRVSRRSPLFLSQGLIFPSALSPRLVRIVCALPGKRSQFSDGDNDKRGREGREHRAHPSPPLRIARGLGGNNFFVHSDYTEDRTRCV